MDGAGWRRAARCVSEDNCVEVADGGRTIGIRSSLAPEVELAFPVADWSSFVGGIKVGQFDLPAVGRH